jgi:hypothetical protein
LPGPKGDEIALAKLATPYRAFSGLPVTIPKTIASAEIRLSPGPNGGVVIDVLAHDESEAQAITDARTLTNALDLGIMVGLLIGSIHGSFEADGSDIRGEIAMPRKQVEAILELARGFLGGSARPRASASPVAPTAPVVP